MNADLMLRNLAATQHGVVSLPQARGAGLTRAAIRHRTAKGLWRPVGSLFVVSGSPESFEQRLMAAVLDAGADAVASHEAAAVLWELPGFSPGSLDVTRPRTTARMRPALGEVHESRRLPESHRTVVRGIPVSTVARTLFDLAGAPGMPEARVERAVDNALARSPALLRRLHIMLRELAVRGRPGIALMRELLDERPANYIAPASGLEARAIRLLADAGIATDRQVDVGDRDWVGRVDLRVTGTNVVIEIDSALHHTAHSDRLRDADRDASPAAAGLVVVRATDDDVFHRPWVLEQRVRRALSGLRSGRVSDHFAPQFAGGGVAG
ncbi:MAG: hypothetical protein KY443_06775 [Actinobacteria bacterium]|nr:hypothetical protein [Actinomycetota bacterium]